METLAEVNRLRDQVIEALLDGSCLFDDAGKTQKMYALKLGHLEGLNQLANMRFEDEVVDDGEE